MLDVGGTLFSVRPESDLGSGTLSRLACELPRPRLRLDFSEE